MISASRAGRALTIGLGVLACCIAPAAAHAASPIALGLNLAPASAPAATPIALGVNIAKAPDGLAPIQSYASIAGANPAIVMWYQQWSEPLYYSDQLANMTTLGATPLITWDPLENGAGIPLEDIVNGDYDSYIEASAKLAAAWGSPLFIRFGHEMNLSGSGYGPGDEPGNTPAEFVAAWRHIVTIFREEHATNVEWVWSPNVDCDGGCPFTAFYPGNSWVDWVALDGYNYASVDDVPWMTFSQIFGPSYAIMQSLTSKPMMIAETASAEAGGSKAEWITQGLLQSIPLLYPDIHALVWFDQDKETNWMVNSSSTSLAAWQQVVASTRYQGNLSTLESIAPIATDVTSDPTTTTDPPPPVSGTSGTTTTTTAVPPPASETPGTQAKKHKRARRRRTSRHARHKHRHHRKARHDRTAKRRDKAKRHSRTGHRAKVGRRTTARRG